MNKKIKHFTADDEYIEASFIVHEVEKLVGGFHTLSGGKRHTDSHYGFSDIAILFRTRAIGKVLLSVFKKSSIPVSFGDAAPFLADYPFHLIIDVLKLYLDAKDMIALDSTLTYDFRMDKKQKQTFLAENSEEKRFEALFGTEDFASDGAESAMKFIFQKFIPDETLDDIGLIRKDVILKIAKECGSDIEQFLHQLLLGTYTDVAQLKTDAVQLLTFHASKVLEFPVVFIAGSEEGITPTLKKDSDIEEERRLFYVAMTRAKDQLFITHASERQGFKEVTKNKLSRFVQEIPSLWIETVHIQKKQAKPEQMKLF